MSRPRSRCSTRARSRTNFHRPEKADDRDDEPDDVGAGGKSVTGNLRKLGIQPVQFSGQVHDEVKR